MSTPFVNISNQAQVPQQWNVYQAGLQSGQGLPGEGVGSVFMSPPNGGPVFPHNPFQYSTAPNGLISDGLSMNLTTPTQESAWLTQANRHPVVHVGSSQSESVLTQMQNTITSLEAKIATIAASTSAIVGGANGASVAPIVVAHSRDSIKITCAVQLATKDLLGITAARGEDNELDLMLPKPLAVGMPYRRAPDNSRLWNPDWTQPSTFALNTQFIEAIVDLVVDHEKSQPTLGNLDRRSLTKMARQYFKTLRQNYKAQTTTAGQVRRERKSKINKHRGRKRTKCDNLRKHIPAFREAHGQDSTVGLEEIVLTDYMSSEHSDPGNVDVETFNAYRFKNGGGSSGLEIRKVAWRSRMLNRVYAQLRTFQRRAERKTAAEDAGRKRSRAGKARIARFCGMVENTNFGSPPLGNRGSRKAFQACVSEKWAAETDNLDILMAANPVEFTIFALKIEDSDLDAEDLKYLGDDEGSDNEGLSGETVAHGD